MKRFGHAVDKTTGKVVLECFGPPNARMDGDYLSGSIYALSETLIRGKFPNKRGGLFGGDFGYAVDYENESFLLHPDYQDASCSCGFDRAYEAAGLEGHDPTCAASVIGEKLKSWPETPHVELMTRWDLEKRLVDRVAARLGSNGRWGCTCGSEARRKEWLRHHDHDPRCLLTLPNFRYKPVPSFDVTWYKYIGRDMKPTRELTAQELSTAFNTCWKSIPGEIRKAATKDARKENHANAKISTEERQVMDSAVFAALDNLHESEKPCWKCSKSDGMIGGTTHQGPAGRVAFTLRDKEGRCHNCKTITIALRERILLQIDSRNNRGLFKRPPTIGEKIPPGSGISEPALDRSTEVYQKEEKL